MLPAPCPASERDAAAGAEHAMPRELRSRRQLAQHASDPPRAARQAGQPRDLSVRGDAAARDRIDDGLHAMAHLVALGARREPRGCDAHRDASVPHGEPRRYATPIVRSSCSLPLSTPITFITVSGRNRGSDPLLVGFCPCVEYGSLL